MMIKAFVRSSSAGVRKGTNNQSFRKLSRFATPVVNDLPASGIREIMSKADELQSQGKTIIHLNVGQPNFESPKEAVLASANAVSAGTTKYSPNDGQILLRTEIASRYTRHGVPTSLDQILVTTGSALSLFSILASTLQAGDECLIPLPGFPNYHQVVSLMNAVPVPYVTDRRSGYCPTVDQIASLITPRTKCLLICNPGNPTGASFSRDLVEQLVKLTREKNILLISDEIYGDITFDAPHTCAAEFDAKYTPAGAESHIAVISGVSKSFAMTGFRIGWTRCSPQLKECMTKLQEPLVSCSTAFAQVGAAAALKHSEDYMRSMAAEYKKRRDAALAILTARGRTSDYIPGGAFYLPLDISHTNMGSYEFALKLLTEKSVAVAPGSAFDTAQILPCLASQNKKTAAQQAKETHILNEFVRISFANSLENVSEGISRICDLMDEIEKNSTTIPLRSFDAKVQDIRSASASL